MFLFQWDHAREIHLYSTIKLEMAAKAGLILWQNVSAYCTFTQEGLKYLKYAPEIIEQAKVNLEKIGSKL